MLTKLMVVEWHWCCCYCTVSSSTCNRIRYGFFFFVQIFEQNNRMNKLLQVHNDVATFKINDDDDDYHGNQSIEISNAFDQHRSLDLEMKKKKKQKRRIAHQFKCRGLKIKLNCCIVCNAYIAKEILFFIRHTKSTAFIRFFCK